MAKVIAPTPRTVEWFNNYLRFIRDTEATTDYRVVARCDSEPRLTFVRENNTASYYVDDKKVEDQSSEGVVAALNATLGV